MLPPLVAIQSDILATIPTESYQKDHNIRKSCKRRFVICIAWGNSIKLNVEKLEAYGECGLRGIETRGFHG